VAELVKEGIEVIAHRHWWEELEAQLFQDFFFLFYSPCLAVLHVCQKNVVGSPPPPVNSGGDRK
jgi:hypothetical protein